MTWYYVKDGEPAGPISDAELASKLRIGAILPTTLVWRAGMPEWLAASKIELPLVMTEPERSPAVSFNAVIDAPPELTPSTPPVFPNFFCTYCGVIIPADQLVRIGGRAVCASCKPIYVQQVQEGVRVPAKAPVVGVVPQAIASGTDGELADPAMRLIAYILDSIFVSVPTFILLFLFVMIVGFTAASGGNSPGNEAAIGFIFFALAGLLSLGVCAYWVIFLGRRGATPGMKIVKIKMVRSDRGPVSFPLALGRTMLFLVINMFTFSLTNITAFFDREKRTFVDMICGTRVVRD